MLIKTVALPSSISAIAEAAHRFLTSPPGLTWRLEFRRPAAGDVAGSGPLRPSLSIDLPAPLDVYASKAELLAFATQLGQRILDRQETISIGEISIRVPELARVRLDQSSIANGYLTLPPISIEIPSFPDPCAVGIRAEPGERSFLVHLRGRVSGAPLEVRLTF